MVMESIVVHKVTSVTIKMEAHASHSLLSLNSVESPKKSLGGNKYNDGQTVCPDEATCCALEDGSFGCCPFPSVSLLKSTPLK